MKTYLINRYQLFDNEIVEKYFTNGCNLVIMDSFTWKSQIVDLLLERGFSLDDTNMHSPPEYLLEKLQATDVR